MTQEITTRNSLGESIFLDETGTTLFKLNNFNDISWWNIRIHRKFYKPFDREQSVEAFQVIKTWNHRLPDQRQIQHSANSAALPLQETGNIEIEEFEFLEDAIKEARSRYNFMIDRRGYSTTIPTTAPNLPMLCQEYKKDPTWQSYALQPKLDGIRCIMSKEGLLSRTNNLITSCPHLELYSQLLPPGIKLDGELYIDGVPMDMIESLVMRKSPTRDSYKEVCYHVFDIIDLEAPFFERIEEVDRIIKELEEKYLKYRMTDGSPSYFSLKFPFRVVETVLYESPIHRPTIDEYFKKCISRGYEGCIVRNSNSSYEPNKRSSNILKLKEFFDDEFEIIDVLAGKGNTAVFVCAVRQGGEFRCSFKATEERRRQLLTIRENLIGKWLRVEHEGLFNNGKPRCPVGIHYFDQENHD
jgi:DNA ligase-1